MTRKDRDRGWTVELALPWAGMKLLTMGDGRSAPPKDGDVWRMDFSRFNQFKEAPPANDSGGWAWSAHGVWDSHVPEVFPFRHILKGNRWRGTQTLSSVSRKPFDKAVRTRRSLQSNRSVVCDLRFVSLVGIRYITDRLISSAAIKVLCPWHFLPHNGLWCKNSGTQKPAKTHFKRFAKSTGGRCTHFYADVFRVRMRRTLRRSSFS